MKKRHVLAWALFLTCIATASGAADNVVPTDAATRERLFDAKFLLGRERYDEAAAIYRELIAKDVPEAMWQLGAMLQAGTLGAPDEHEGRALFQRAAATGGRYQCEVGAMVFFGVDGFARDPEEGRRLIQDAIQGGYVDGYHHLAMLEEDPAARARTLREGADRGSAQCRLALGFAYLDGRGVPADRNAGVRYLSLAADADPSFLSRALSGLIDAGGVEPETLLRLAEKLEQHCLAAGDPDLAPAFLELSHMFRNGIVFEQDDAKADFWLEQAKNFGSNTLLAALADGGGFPAGPETDTSPSTVPGVDDDEEAEELAANRAEYEELMAKADEYTRKENWVAARFCYEQALWVKGYRNDPAALAALERFGELEREAMLKTLKEGIALFEQGDHGAAVGKLLDLKTWDGVYPPANACLARAYYYALGITESYENAVEMARIAAEHDDPVGMNMLGVCLENGHGVEKNLAEAFGHFSRAAELGNANAMVNIGRHYEHGFGRAVDLPEAARWYRRAADAGSVHGQFNYGRALLEGKGVPVNDAEAFSYFRRAADQGSDGAQFYLGYMFATGRGVRQDYAQAAEWYRKSADAGNISSQNNLGVLYLNGWGVRRDPVEAAKWYRKAAEGGDVNGQSNLGGMLYDGTAGYTDYAEAFKWTRAGAEGGNAEAMHRLGHMYYESKGAPYNYEEARRWFRLAKEKGHADCDASRALIGH